MTLLSFPGALLQNVSRLPVDDHGRSLLAVITTTRQPAEESTDIALVDEAAAHAVHCPIDVATVVAMAVAKAADDPAHAAMLEADEAVVLVERGVAVREVKEASVPLVMVVSRRPRRSLTQRWRTTLTVAVVLSQAGQAATTLRAPAHHRLTILIWGLSKRQKIVRTWAVSRMSVVLLDMTRPDYPTCGLATERINLLFGKPDAIHMGILLGR